MPEVGPDGDRILFSASEEYLGTAVHELRTAFGGTVERCGPDCGVIEAAGTLPEVAAACRDGRIAFVRHLAGVRARLDPAADVAAIRAAAVDLLSRSSPVPGGLAVQVWKSGAGPAAPTTDVAAGVREALVEHGVEVSPSGREHVLSVCLTPAGVLLGLNRTADALSDWPGGRVRLAKRQGQVSRAEFKLEELFGVLPLALPATGAALDLGAAPGGWTRILRLRGLAVWAIDPGELDPRVAADPGVHHVRTTAGEFFRSTALDFDLAVNDMRMDAELSCRVMRDAAVRLRRGAVAVVTLKVGSNRPLAALRRCREILDDDYEPVFARQLQHNRHELTLVARRR
jgi:23S rRNA (cytidine2498-2'-O)-methyltransferase